MKIFTFPQYEAEWWATRRGVPTASEFHRIITAVKGDLSSGWFGYAAELCADRLNPDYGQTDEYVSAAMKNGSRLEPEARRFYEFDRDCKVQQVGFCIDDAGQFGCSPDGLVGDDGGLESKSPDPKTHVRYLVAGVLPDDYRQQVHASLAITGRAWWDWMSYLPGFPPLIVRVKPDDYTEAVRKAMDDFWPKYQAMWEKVLSLGATVPYTPEETTTDEDEAAACFVPGGRR